MTRNVVFILSLVAIMSSQFAHAKADYQALLNKLGPGLQYQSERKSSLSGFNEVIVNNQVILISDDQRYVIIGPILDMSLGDNGVPLGEDFISANRITILDAVDSSSLITFKPEEIKAKVKVFTDIDCYYCRKLHLQMNEILEQGIQISYLSFPISAGSNKTGAGYSKAVSVWCASDRNEAITKAKQGEVILDSSCEHPVDNHVSIARNLNINVTPTLIFEDGHVERGYLPPAELAKLAILHSKRGD